MPELGLDQEGVVPPPVLPPPPIAPAPIATAPPPPPPMAPVAAAAAAADPALAEVRQSLARLSEQFDQKIMEDRFKEEQIRRLHAELQDYKRGLLDQILMPLLSQVVRLHENLRRQERALRAKPPEELGPQRVFKEIANMRDELEVLLGESGVAVYEHPGTAYDAGRQIAREAVPTDDPALHGVVCERLLPGFERDGRVIFKERVKVYACSPANKTTAAPAQAVTPAPDATSASTATARTAPVES